jgi:hypothetical protein
MITSIVSFQGVAQYPGVGIRGPLHVRQCVPALVDAYRPLASEYAVVIGEE